jgi:endonuclease/exonuclease/phosphatase family metal-dependent hydrolase
MDDLTVSRNVLLMTAVLWPVSSVVAWDPNSGDWSKSEVTDVRIMTWNVEDDICSSCSKVEGLLRPWEALTRIVAGLQPDILILQEMGDNSGADFGGGGGVDSVSELETTIELFMHGGPDPFEGGSVTAYVQKYAPGYDLPYVFVSTRTDAFNRNVILSRYPFADLNGDTKSMLSDIPILLADEYAPGGTGGIRGYMLAEIDLPDETYAGDLVVGNGHLKAGGSSSDAIDRREAAQNVAYIIDYWLNGAGTGTPNPAGTIFASPAATHTLSENTPVIWGGDWNQDELTDGTKGPADWMTMAENADSAGGADGTDRDGTDSVFDESVHFFTGSPATQSSRKLDYLAWQESIVELRRSFTFNTSGTPTAALPPEVAGFSFPTGASGLASDHRPVIGDFVLPAADPTGPNPDWDGDGDVDLVDFGVFQLCFTGADAGSIDHGCVWADSDSDADVDLVDFGSFQLAFTGSIGG